jgi:hypothetical protein
VAKRLAGWARVISPAANGGDSSNTLRNLDEWVIGEKPVLVHFNCGLHDLKLGKASRQHQVPLDQYEVNLRRIVERLKRETSASIVFASTTPILDDQHAKRGAEFDRFEADVKRYDAAFRRDETCRHNRARSALGCRVGLKPLPKVRILLPPLDLVRQS